MSINGTALGQSHILEVSTLSKALETDRAELTQPMPTEIKLIKLITSLVTEDQELDRNRQRRSEGIRRPGIKCTVGTPNTADEQKKGVTLFLAPLKSYGAPFI